jgi:hypothetical protein
MEQCTLCTSEIVSFKPFQHLQQITPEELTSILKIFDDGFKHSGLQSFGIAICEPIV